MKSKRRVEYFDLMLSKKIVSDYSNHPNLKAEICLTNGHLSMIKVTCNYKTGEEEFEIDLQDGGHLDILREVIKQAEEQEMLYK